MTTHPDFSSPRIAILGGGPGGYEAAIVAASLGAQVTIIERAGLGGSAVLTDVVPSKTLIATADLMTRVAEAGELGVKFDVDGGDFVPVMRADLKHINDRLLNLARSQSKDIHDALASQNVRILAGSGRLLDNHTIEVLTAEGTETIEADTILLAVGAHPRELATARPDGERILNWTQLYNLDELPEELIVVGSGVTGAEFASAYNGLGSKVTLVSSRDRVLPGSDVDAAVVLEEVFERRGVRVLSRSRAESVERTDDGVVVTLSDGTKVTGSHCLLCLGSIPNTDGIGLEEAGVAVSESGHIKVDGVSRTSAPNIYAAGDCTGVLPLASVAAMQGRIAVAHFMGDVVTPLKLHQVASNIFTSPEIANVGVSEADIDSGKYQGDVVKLSMRSNARAKMRSARDGFVKIFARKGSGTVIGGVVVGPNASELIFPIAIAVKQKLHVDDVASTFTVYPSLTGSISEAARRLHVHM
ncbi:NAD(P)H-quinone dehydrogenase [Pseudarthrobacter sp. SL88]|uniref:NAD(P)H-quinone dehydrogenase n=1 Tax=Micrococcaceae TaxID=1268 RepID=UPI0007020214|nr:MULTISPECIES: NAD(P)H-quinone dehydrogenase [Micrococcaceae]KQQ82591.1 flavoprotein disulfide reductase [Arthrobacter sp. Leaf137]MCT9626505.1 NAD(P)H-quinone dehydrogenase [Pseudarthrobacter equi]MCY1675397.1 NAD(P)H-quinone dehydrogenase [Pseudarthrobacter sp. SL88]MDQ1052579.1 pyruvate/2-oxoglutarate dehydrogenase complex dihydrolipoamide dehydrogenase (E3) component [Arthrobacter sp. SORGH_AS_0212]